MSFRAASLTSALLRALVANVAKLGIGEKELLGGAIEHTDLPWQAPPLKATALLGGVPFSDYMDSRPPTFDAAKLVSLWTDVMSSGRIAPLRYVNEHGWLGLGGVFPHIRQGERMLWLGKPVGYPALDDYAGAMLSIECAYVLVKAGLAEEAGNDFNSYYARLPEGIEVGVKDGLPTLCADQWDLSVEGMVPSLMAMPRGETFVGCDYDLIAKIRSVVHANQDLLPEYEGCELACQALRILSEGRHLPELAARIRGLKTAAIRSAERARILREAISLANIVSISDRRKVEGLYAMLVPIIMPASTFKATIYYTMKVPPMIERHKMENIKTTLQNLLEKEE